MIFFFRIILHELQGSYFISFLFFPFPLGGSSGLHLSQSPGLGQNPVAALLSDLWKDAVDWSVYTLLLLLRSHCLQTGAVNLISVKNTRNGHFFLKKKVKFAGYCSRKAANRISEARGECLSLTLLLFHLCNYLFSSSPSG